MAYLYSIWNGRLVEYLGNVVSMPRPGWSVFKSSKKKHRCSPKPGELYNSVIWFEEPNEEKAKQILIDYEKRMIRNCEIKIVAHQQKIKALEDLPLIVF